MVNLCRCLTLFLVVILTVSNLLMIGSSDAQTVPPAIPKPSVPSFTLHFVDNSLLLTIQNQPLVYQYNGSFFYNVHFRSHGSENWTQLRYNGELDLADANSAQTSIDLGPLEGANGLSIPYKLDVPLGCQLDVQIQALIGGFFKVAVGDMVGLGHTEFSGETSDWSGIQTITVPDDAMTMNLPTPTGVTPTPTQSLPNIGPTSSPIPNSGDIAVNLSLIAVTVSVVCVIFLLLYVRHLKKSLSPNR
jgi:hypothetical protein